ncbi:hypothetical protein HDA39_002331 [Kribbella italica]|uniref:Uncharacterized protein n=1 Tax=Kribbella italica TaxID=1540520 RepID=A0A7W9J4Q8_9ACTN|nr:hypothetical protein [Kribbella italica]
MMLSSRKSLGRGLTTIEVSVLAGLKATLALIFRIGASCHGPVPRVDWRLS